MTDARARGAHRMENSFRAPIPDGAGASVSTRILARIEDGKAVIEVVRVGHRQGVYKNMPRL